MSVALVIGAGPAGLMAANELALAGHRVIVAEAKASVGRKFLMAGKSGLNLTMDEPFEVFLTRFGDSAGQMRDILAGFNGAAVQDWARGLDQEVFTGSSGRVFPKSMKASPLLRAWLLRLQNLGVEFRTRWRWTGWQGAEFTFDTADGPVELAADRAVLALGGSSWARLGSNGAWAATLREHNIAVNPFLPANVGLQVDWSPHMQRVFGSPVKGTLLQSGGTSSGGEFVISARGLEGGGIYSMTPAIRQGADLVLDLMPGWTRQKLTARLAQGNRKDTVTNQLRKTLRLNPAKIALLMEFGRPLPTGAALANLIKSLPIRHCGPGPLDGAISTAGGVAWDAVDDRLMLRNAPGVYVAGEMMDWEAPTGGYLITACLATGKWAGRHAGNLA